MSAQDIVRGACAYCAHRASARSIEACADALLDHLRAAHQEGGILMPVRPQ